jgi:hypothetical protein
LDEYFLKSPIELRSLNSVVALDELPISTANLNAVSLEAAGILKPGQAIGGSEMSKSTSDVGLLELLSLGIDLMSNLSSETNVVVKHSPFVRHLILEDFA